MADGQNRNLSSVVAIERDVGPLAKFNHPLAELGWQIFDGTADLRVLAEDFLRPAESL